MPNTESSTPPPAHPTAGERLRQIGNDLDRTGAAWAKAGYPYYGAEYEARQAVFARLREWNEQHA